MVSGTDVLLALCVREVVMRDGMEQNTSGGWCGRVGGRKGFGKVILCGSLIEDVSLKLLAGAWLI